MAVEESPFAETKIYRLLFRYRWLWVAAAVVATLVGSIYAASSAEALGPSETLIVYQAAHAPGHDGGKLAPANTMTTCDGAERAEVDMVMPPDHAESRLTETIYLQSTGDDRSCAAALAIVLAGLIGGPGLGLGLVYFAARRAEVAPRADHPPRSGARPITSPQKPTVESLLKTGGGITVAQAFYKAASGKAQWN